MKNLEFTLNGRTVSLDVSPDENLLEVLRGRLGLTGTKVGCGSGECGACTVIVDGRAINSCIMPALEANGRNVVTIEGLSGEEGGLDPLQMAFVEHGAIQCGFCTPGMIMSAKALLNRNPEPSEDQIRTAIEGNLCRCTGYQQIVEAVQAAGRKS